MTNYIKNKTALITGAASGIGKQLAFDLAKMQTNLVLVGRNKEKLQELRSSILENNDIKISTIQLDVSNKNKVATLLKDVKVDYLINNAGLALGLERLEQGKEEEWDGMIDTNIKGLLYVSKALTTHLRTLETAHIINIGSVAGKTAYPNGNVYCATKAAVHSLGESMNVDFYGTKVKVTTIAPGAVRTNFSNVGFHNDDEKINAVYEGYTPLEASDISDVIINVLNTPKHVNIQYLDIMPTAQRNPYMLYREK